jgi:hypothetical protein
VSELIVIWLLNPAVPPKLVINTKSVYVDGMPLKTTAEVFEAKTVALIGV